VTGWQWIVGLVLLAHGVGHVLGLLPVFGDDLPAGWNARSWLLTTTLGETASKGISAVLWSTCTILFFLASLAVLGWGIPYEWWRPLAVVGAALSTVTLGLFWNGFPALFPNKIGALAVNLVVLGGVLAADWPTDEMLGR
jgi:hypothetical protein